MIIAADARAGRTAPGPARTPLAVTEVAAPVLSARRTPVVLAADATRERYRGVLNDVARGIEGDGASCFAASLDGTPVLSIGGDRLVVPASNMKLITAAVALEVLGPTHTFTTTVAGTLTGTTVAGDLYFVGGGDATLSRREYRAEQKYNDPPQPFTDLAALADQVAATGLRRVTGRLVADESRYDTKRYIDQWQAGIVEEGEAGPLSALLVDDGKVAVGDRLPATEPALTAAEVFRSLLEARGVAIDGGVATGTMPAGTPTVTSIASPPLTDVLRELLSTSDDNTAELMVKELGVVAGAGGTTAAGLDIMRRTLTTWGIALDGVELFDGSGLSNADRVRCSTILGVLDHLGAADAYYDALPVALRTGTLKDELELAPLAGVLHAKTGSLDIAKALSGYVRGEPHSIAFSLILNGPARQPAQRYPQLWADLAQGLATIPDPVDPESLAPVR